VLGLSRDELLGALPALRGMAPESAFRGSGPLSAG